MKKTIGEMIDLLITTNIRTWMLEDIKRNSEDDAEIAKACKMTNKTNVLRNILIENIDNEINFLLESGD